jgi:hypothetical protein
VRWLNVVQIFRCSGGALRVPVARRDVRAYSILHTLLPQATRTAKKKKQRLLHKDHG